MDDTQPAKEITFVENKTAVIEEKTASDLINEDKESLEKKENQRSDDDFESFKLSDESKITERVSQVESSTDKNTSTSIECDNSSTKIPRPLCADYRSDSDSVDSESDSTSSVSESSSSSSYDSDDSGTVRSDKKPQKKSMVVDLSLSDLPPIEELKISVAEEACVEIGTITSIVDTLVIVESYKGTAALDVETVLFLDNGKRTLGRIFDILGPISEPVYAVRFNSNEQISQLKIEKGLKVFYAPKTQHTSFVFLSEIMKIRGSDASWKDNIEAPAEYQDFSDDEEERKCKSKGAKTGESSENFNENYNSSRKRPFPKYNQHSKIIQPSRFRAPENRLNPQNHLLPNPCARFRPPPPATSFPPSEPPSFPPPHTPLPYPGDNFFARCPPQMCIPTPPHVPVPPPQHYPPPPYPPHIFFTPRFSGPPFPTFSYPAHVAHAPNFQQPFHQQRNLRYNAPAWDSLIQIRSSPPPPPPPPSTS